MLTLYTSGMGHGRSGMFGWGCSVVLLLDVLVKWELAFRPLRPIRNRTTTCKKPRAPVARRDFEIRGRATLKWAARLAAARVENERPGRRLAARPGFLWEDR